ncbi:MAG: alpha/beta hydrolase [Bacteroidales bacterium]|nr:alpha/beta hydrolase [Bacteroidales bacterium]MBN2817844.1 alpha/beta hydrolase [Bacteroidales bacterium]
MILKDFFFRSRRIHFKLVGEGYPILLLHGYQADSRIWEYFTPFMEGNYQLIIPDIPGHGNSPYIQAVNTMEHLAELINRLILFLGIPYLSLAGHSMGGYIALAMAEKNISSFDHVFLINSHPFADSMTRALARSREADLIEQGRKHQILISFVRNNFYEGNHAILNDAIKFATKVAIEQPEKGMLADLTGMMARKDRLSVIEKNINKFHIITGENDDKIPPQLFYKMKDKGMNLHLLEECGHLSILEHPEKVAEIIKRVCREKDRI